MDDLDSRVGEQVVERVVRSHDPERLGPRGAAFGGAAEHAPDLDADPAQGLHVDRADEARPDDGRTDVGDPCHRPLTPALPGSARRPPGGGSAPVNLSHKATPALSVWMCSIM